VYARLAVSRHPEYESTKDGEQGKTSAPFPWGWEDGRLCRDGEAGLVTCEQVEFEKFAKVGEAVEAFDEMLKVCVKQSRPVYASVPSDWWEVDVPVELLESKLEP
jgi:hypothetical protein